MKLYTEEQVRKAIRDTRYFTNADSENDIINNMTPIELPSDEEKEKYIKSFPYTKHLDDGQYNDGVLVGVELGIEWIIDKIKNQH